MDSFLAERMKSLGRSGPEAGSAGSFESVESALADKNSIIADFRSNREVARAGSELFRLPLTAIERSPPSPLSLEDLRPACLR